MLLPLTGSAADRFDRRRVAAIALAAEVLTSVLYCLYAAARSDVGGADLRHRRCCSAPPGRFAAPSFRSLPPLIAPDGGLPRLMALYSGTWQFGLIVGPAASGFLYAVDPTVPYLVAAVVLRDAAR